jgi:subtilisin family serine protease/subtilisin-like proprotein convertase family protein
MKKILLASAISAIVAGCGGSSNHQSEAISEPLSREDVILNKATGTDKIQPILDQLLVYKRVKTADYQEVIDAKNLFIKDISDIQIKKAPDFGRFEYALKDHQLFITYTPNETFKTQGKGYDEVTLTFSIQGKLYSRTLTFIASDQSISDLNESLIITPAQPSNPALEDSHQPDETNQPKENTDNEEIVVTDTVTPTIPVQPETSEAPETPTTVEATPPETEVSLDPLVIHNTYFPLKEDEALHQRLKVAGLNNEEPVEISLISIPSKGVLKTNGLDFTYTPLPNLFGNDKVSINISQGNRSLKTELMFAIEAINDAPTLKDVILNTDPARQAIKGQFVVEDPDNVLHQFRITQAPNQGSLSVDQASGAFVANIDPSNPTKEIRFRLNITDGEMSKEHEVAINLTGALSHPDTLAVFDIDTEGGAPIIATPILLMKEDSAVERSIKVTNLRNAKPHFEIKEQGSAINVDIDASTGALRIVAVPNFNGIDSFLVKVSAGVYEVEKWIKVFVTNVNDEPVYLGKQKFYILEDKTLKYSDFKISDIDGDNVRLSIAAKPKHGQLFINASMIMYSPEPNYYGSDQFRLALSDDYITVEKEFNVEIKGVNDRPSAIGGSITLGTDNHVPITLPGQDPDNDKLTYEILNADTLKYGILKPKALEWHDNIDVFAPEDSIDLSNEYVYQLKEGVVIEEALEVIQYQVTDPNGESQTGYFYIVLTGDPLYPEQWHLHNIGQKAWAINGGDPGNDLHIQGLHKEGVRGKGIIVLVADTGLEIEHEDLVNNVLKNRSIDLKNADSDPSPSWLGGRDHGTAVAGLIAAEMNNRKGGRGVAPEASLIGMNFLREQSFESWYKSHGMKGYSDDVHIFNQSYGLSTVWPLPFDFSDNFAEEKVFQATTKTNNQGKGALYIKAAGNGFSAIGSDFVYQQNRYKYVVRPRDARILPMGNINIDPSNASFYNLSISALAAGSDANHGRLLSSYSSTGSAVLLASPGGQYGEDHPAMVTTDASGCQRGYAVDNRTPFHQGGHPLNPDCKYTSIMNGTSSAAPNASGAFALVWGERPDLSWRDIKHIMLSSADPIDQSIEPVSLALGDGDYVAQEAWITNKAGYAFHNNYGFGRINATKAVNISKRHKPLPALTLSPWLSPYRFKAQDIPDNSIKGASIQFDPTKLVDARLEHYSFDPNFVIEGVQVMISTTHQRDADLSIELSSPTPDSATSATRSVLLTGRNALLADQQDSAYLAAVGQKADFNDFVMLSNAFYGENVAGKWTLKVVDTHGGDMKIGLYPDRFGSTTDKAFPNNKQDGKVTDYKVRFYGHVNK